MFGQARGLRVRARRFGSWVRDTSPLDFQGPPGRVCTIGVRCVESSAVGQSPYGPKWVWVKWNAGVVLGSNPF